MYIFFSLLVIHYVYPIHVWEQKNAMVKRGKQNVAASLTKAENVERELFEITARLLKVLWKNVYFRHSNGFSEERHAPR